MGGLVKIVTFLACKLPSSRNVVAHNKLVDDVIEVLDVVSINDLSGQRRGMTSFIPVVHHAIREFSDSCIPCADIAEKKCPGDDAAMLFAQELDGMILHMQTSPAQLEELELQFKNFLKPVAAIAIGRIGVADEMFEVDPVDAHTETILSRIAELAFKRYATTTSRIAGGGGPAKEKEQLLRQYSRVPEARRVLYALWSNPLDFEGAIRGVSDRRSIALCKRIFSRCQKMAPKDSIEYFLEHNKVSMERIAYLRDSLFYEEGRHRFCSGGPEVERQLVFDCVFPSLEYADCDVKAAVQALWGGERRKSVLLSKCFSQLAKDWMSGVLRFVTDLDD
jgi:hypothetical protein